MVRYERNPAGIINWIGAR